MASRLSIRKLAVSGMFCGLIFIMTMVSIPVGNGYIHVGDSINYLGSCLLPFPFGAFAGAIGGALSDLTLGYVAYILPTFIVKLCNSLVIYLIASHSDKIFTARSVIASILSGVVTIGGYYLVAIALYGGIEAQLATIPANIVQAAASAVIFLAVGKMLDTAGLTHRLKNKVYLT